MRRKYPTSLVPILKVGRLLGNNELKLKIEENIRRCDIHGNVLDHVPFSPLSLPAHLIVNGRWKTVLKQLNERLNIT